MQVDADLSGILSSFTAATGAALTGLSTQNVLPVVPNGISLLDVKSEIFLSYLQALALRNLHVIRSLKAGVDASETQKLSDELTRKLIEHRVYLERGARPLEQKIKFQVDTVIRAAEDDDRRKTQDAALASKKGEKESREADEESDGSSDEDEDDDDDDVSAADDDELGENAYRSNAGAIEARVKDKPDANGHGAKSRQDGIYRPPRIAATLMPTTETKEKRTRERRMQSSTLNEYVDTELSAAPLAEPSIGSNIAAGGRSSKDRRQLAKEQERRDYEETNLVRLPKESKKEMAKVRARARGGFGGEEWADLGNSLSRIADVTRRKGGREGAYDRSRKRASTEDNPRGSGIGDAFDVKRRRTLKNMARR